ncbi:MAG TPA: hypothetical protein VMT76_07875 [Puia sp.]|nr:hypothetical protein [Puia sp.]
MKRTIILLSALSIVAIISCKKSSNTPANSAPITLTGFTPSHAYEGDTIILSGTGFLSSDSVLFNGTLATMILDVSATSMKVIVPADATTGTIQVIHNGYSAGSGSSFTVDLPITANATVTKLVDIPAYPTNGGSGVRMLYANNSLFITGPGTNQNAVYKVDLTTNAVVKYVSFPSTPLVTGIAGYNNDSSFIIISAESVPSGNNYLYTWRYGNLTTSSSTGHIYFNSLKFNPAVTGFIGTDFSNNIYKINSVTYGGNANSSDFDTLLNTQLKGTPNEANAMLGIGHTGNIFVFANHALWQLQTDKTLKLIAGQAGVAGYNDAQGNAALFYDGGYARGNAITVDNTDNVYVADYGSGCIRKVDNSGSVTTVVGDAKYKGKSFTGAGNKMAFFFDSWDITFGSDYKTMYVIARNNTNNATMPNSVYKVTFQ